MYFHYLPIQISIVLCASFIVFSLWMLQLIIEYKLVRSRKQELDSSQPSCSLIVVVHCSSYPLFLQIVLVSRHFLCWLTRVCILQLAILYQNSWHQKHLPSFSLFLCTFTSIWYLCFTTDIISLRWAVRNFWVCLANYSKLSAGGACGNTYR